VAVISNIITEDRRDQTRTAEDAYALLKQLLITDYERNTGLRLAQPSDVTAIADFIIHQYISRHALWNYCLAPLPTTGGV
jgi:hypothetical protein